MNSSCSWTRGLTLLWTLATVLTMTACQTPSTGPTAASRELARELVSDICRRAWLPVEYDSEADSPETVDGNRASNRRRAAFCGEETTAPQ